MIFMDNDFVCQGENITKDIIEILKMSRSGRCQKLIKAFHYQRDDFQKLGASKSQTQNT